MCGRCCCCCFAFTFKVNVHSVYAVRVYGYAHGTRRPSRLMVVCLCVQHNNCMCCNELCAAAATFRQWKRLKWTKQKQRNRMKWSISGQAKWFGNVAIPIFCILNNKKRIVCVSLPLQWTVSNWPLMYRRTVCMAKSTSLPQKMVWWKSNRHWRRHYNIPIKYGAGVSINCPLTIAKRMAIDDAMRIIWANNWSISMTIWAIWFCPATNRRRGMHTSIWRVNFGFVSFHL